MIQKLIYILHVWAWTEQRRLIHLLMLYKKCLYIYYLYQIYEFIVMNRRCTHSHAIERTTLRCGRQECACDDDDEQTHSYIAKTHSRHIHTRNSTNRLSPAWGTISSHIYTQFVWSQTVGRFGLLGFISNSLYRCVYGHFHQNGTGVCA